MPTSRSIPIFRRWEELHAGQAVVRRSIERYGTAITDTASLEPRPDVAIPGPSR